MSVWKILQIAPRSESETQAITPGVLQDVLVAPYNDIEANRVIIEKKAANLAAVIIELILGNLGMIPSTREFLAFLREIARKHEIILILDEIITYRLSIGGVQEIHEINPDMTTFGKIIGGGLPIGAFGGWEGIMDIFSPKRANPMHHSGTFNGNAVTMAAAIAAMNLIDQSLIERINIMGNRWRSSLQEFFFQQRSAGTSYWYGALDECTFFYSTGDRPAQRQRELAVLSACSRPLESGFENRGIYTPRHLMLSISYPMTDAETQQTIISFDQSIDQLKPVIERHCPELLL